jgi:hypothetical protein
LAVLVSTVVIVMKAFRTDCSISAFTVGTIENATVLTDTSFFAMAAFQAA